MVQTPQNTARMKLFNAWTNTLSAMHAMNPKVSIYPKHPSAFLTIAESEKLVTFSVNNPIAFSIPEKTKIESQKETTNQLVVVVSGWLSFNKVISTGKLAVTTSGKFKTRDYRTYLEYYRVANEQKNQLNFLCSIHYDLELKKLNHPIFHAQFIDKPKLVYKTHYKTYLIKPPNIKTTLRTFRIPSMQHDIFSAMTQLSADHLLSESVESYERLIAIRNTCDFFVSAEFKSKLNTEPNCMRSIRFYPD